MHFFHKLLGEMANSIDPDHTAPKESIHAISEGLKSARFGQFLRKI